MNRVRLSLILAAVVAAIAMPDMAAAAPKRLVFKDTEVIKGEVQKPEVAVFISRQNLNKGYEFELKQSFLPQIVDAVNRAPF